MYSSVYFSRRMSKIHYWEYDENGKKCYKSEPAPLYFYIKNAEGEYTSLFGDKLKRISFTEFDKFKNAREMFKNSNTELFESDLSIENRFILDHYSPKEKNIPKYEVLFFDIEVHSEQGFPTPAEAAHPIVIITLYSTKDEKFYIFAEKEFDRSFLPKSAVVKTYDGDEKTMLKEFISFIRKKHPDFLSGWNSNYFDIVYIYNRIKNLLGEDIANMLSPIKQVRKILRKTRWGLPQEMYQIMGINCIDYLELYRKYEAGERESYKLGYIAEFELEETKLEYEGSLKALYHNDWQKYVEYNVQDVKLLIKLDNKKRYFNVMTTICCNCCVPFEQYDKTVRVLDGAFISRLMHDKIILPDSKAPDEDGEQYEGGFVFPTTPGVFDWVVSFDATSLYPSAILEHNISPETKVFVVDRIAVEKVCDLLEGKELPQNLLDMEAYAGKTVKEVVEIIKTNKYSIASNGAVYRHDKLGVVTQFIADWFDKRQYHKKLEKTAKSEGNKEEASKHGVLQYNYKILLNSSYGYLGSKYSRLYDIYNAEAITKVGQESTKTAIETLINYFENKWPESKAGLKVKARPVKDLIIAGDTDSTYINVGNILKSFNYPYIEDIDKCKVFINKKINPLIDAIVINAMNHLATVRLNAPANKIFFKREMIARRAIFLKKKNYVAWVMDMEGNAVKDIYNMDEAMKCKGIEYIKSSTVKNVKELMGEFIFELLQNNDKQISDKKLKDLKDRFFKLKAEQIAKIGNIKQFIKYLDYNGVPMKGATGAAKAAGGHNLLLREKGIADLYPPIEEGDKIKIIYLKDCPFYKYEAIGFKETLMSEFGLQNYIDYDKMYDKVLLTPLARFYTALQWELPNFEQEDISDLFS